MHDLCDHTVCFLGNQSSGSVLTDRFYEFCKRSSGVDPATCDFKILAFFCKLMVDLYVSFLAVFDLCMINPHNFYR